MNRTRKGKLEKRVNSVALLKKKQKQHYARVQSKRVTDKGFTSTVTEYFVMGQNVTKMSATEGADTLLLRDAEKFANLPNVDDDQVGPLIVPGTYIPSTAVVSPEEMDFILSQNPNNKKLEGSADANAGEMAEKVAYDVLKKYYGQKKDAALVINNLKMFRVDASKKNNEHEADFLIANYATQTLISLEVKKFLGKPKITNPNKEMPTTKVKQQLKKIREILGETFQEDVKGPWKIVSLAFCLEIDQDIKGCLKCKDFIACGKEELIEKLDKIEAARRAEVKNVNKCPEDFVIICKFLLFCCPLVALPVLGNLPKMIQESIVKRSGTRENILIWCFPTPQQRAVLFLHWLIFAAPFGSGKTLLMTAKAIELADAGEKVLFLVFVDGRIHGSDKKTLLCLDLEEKFKNHPNIKVTMVPFVNGNSDNLKGTYSHVHISSDKAFLKILKQPSIVQE